MTPPDDDELELSLFGPGFGECLLIHAGSGNWIIIDSCINAENNVPASLFYLHQIGVDAATAVKRVVVTHWHDDHIRGMGKVLRSCPSARLCIPMALHKGDFVKAIVDIDDAFSGAVSSGVSEIRQVFESAQMRVNPILASENSVVWAERGAQLAHAADVELRALSPSGLQGLAMLDRVASLIRGSTAGGILGRAPRSGSNDLAIAAWLCCGSHTLLLGADLEVHANPACGWNAVKSIAGQLPGEKAAVFKVPHHGSSNGHDAEVWADMLEPNPIAVLTPWTHGSGLPSQADLERIAGYTDRGYITNLGRMAKVARRDPVVEKTLRENKITLVSCEGVMGHIQLRKKPGAEWRTERHGAAVKFTALA